MRIPACILLFFIFSPDFVFPQREVLLVRSLHVSSPNPDYKLNTCDYGIIVPASRVGRQEVLETKYSIKPDHMIKTDEEEYFLKWKKLSFSQLSNTNLSVTVKIRLSKYDLRTAKRSPKQNPADLDTLKYLKNEENFRYNSRSISEAAQNLNGTTREEQVRNIFEFVKNNLEYHIFLEQDRGAKKALKDGRGDCTEYSELMVTLCRAKKIPARIVMGLIPKITGQVGYHNWVEVFFPEYGWVSFDPTWADHENVETTFDTMINTYIQLSNERFIKSVNCSCNTGAFPYSIALKDSCAELSNSMNTKHRNMISYYNAMELNKAMGLLDTLISFEETNYIYWTFKGMIHARRNEFDKGELCFKRAVENAQTPYEKRQCLYALGNYYALKDDKEKAVKFLGEAMDFGFLSYEHMRKDIDLKNLTSYPPFEELLKEMKSAYEKQVSKNKK
jgi:tetratricopeptide (TPR) repeat protein